MTKKFKKVTEWEKKPNVSLIIFGIFCFIAIIRVGIAESLGEIGGVNAFFVYLLFSLGLVVVFFLNGLGKGRKVYWERVKDE